jgi:hypothetical protein
MIVVNWLALGEDPVLRRPGRQVLTPHKEQHQVGLLRGVRTVVVGYFRSPHDILDAPTVEPRYFFRTEESILQDAVKLACDVILFGSSEYESGGRCRPEQLKRPQQRPVCRENDTERHWRVRQLIIWNRRKEAGCTHRVKIGKASRWFCSMYRLHSRARL